MTGGTLFWYIVGGISAVLFFGIAVVVTWRGIGELRELLHPEDTGNRQSQ